MLHYRGMPKKPGPKPRPRRPREVIDEEYSTDDASYIYKNIGIACVCFAITGLFYLSHTHQAGLLGEWFLTNAHIFLGKIGFYIIPIITTGMGIIHILYKHERAPLHVPVGTLMLTIGTLTTLYTLDPSRDWGGYAGSLLGDPLLVGAGTYIATLLGVALAVVGIIILPRGRDILRHMGGWFESSATSLAANANRIMTRRASAEGAEDEEIMESEEEYADEEYENEAEDSETVERPIRTGTRSMDAMLAAKQPEPLQMKKPSLPVSAYVPPALSLLAPSAGKANAGDVQHNGVLLKQTLQNFNINVEIEEITTGPSITRYALRPSQGLKLSRISQLRNELSLALAAHPIRIEAPIPGQSLVGIEIPNKAKAKVGLRELMEDKTFQKDPRPLTIAIGRGVSGRAYYDNLAKIPHLLIAGTTGSGKSVVAHNIILSLLYRNGPDNLKFIMVDPKRVELTLYNNIPHLLTPVIKDAKKTIVALRWAAKEMDRRYHTLEQHGVRDIQSYHETVVTPAYEAAEIERKRGTPDEEIEVPERMPYIVIMIDELADIMQAYPRELESGIVRLAQMSRAVGIHLVISTQRPSVNVITGLIKANIPGRLALRVASQIDSRTILDSPGAESLLGAGDALFQGEGMSKPERIQSAFASEDEIKNIVADIIKNNRGFPPELIDIGDQVTTEGAIVSEQYGESFNAGEEDDDTMFAEARDLVIKTRVASTSFLQRKLRVGYSRAARLIDLLEERGVIGPSQGSKPREVMGTGHAADDSNSYEQDKEPESDE